MGSVYSDTAILAPGNLLDTWKMKHVCKNMHRNSPVCMQRRLNGCCFWWYGILKRQKTTVEQKFAKPRRVEWSCGEYAAAPEEEIILQHAIDIADDRMYAQKKARRAARA